MYLLVSVAIYGKVLQLGALHLYELGLSDVWFLPGVLGF